MGCHFLLQCMKVKSESEVTQSCPTLNDPMGCSLLVGWLLCPWDFPGKTTGVGCHCLLLLWLLGICIFSMNCLPFVLFIKSVIYHIYLQDPFMINIVFLVALMVKILPAMRETSLIPRLGRSPGNSLQHSCLRIPWTEELGRLQFMGVSKSQTQLSD